MTDFIRDPLTGHLVGIEQAPAAKTAAVNEWPKWVTPHDSQIVRTDSVDGSPPHISTPGWSQFHVNRADGAVSVR